MCYLCESCNLVWFHGEDKSYSECPECGSEEVVEFSGHPLPCHRSLVSRLSDLKRKKN